RLVGRAGRDVPEWCARRAGHRSSAAAAVSLQPLGHGNGFPLPKGGGVGRRRIGRKGLTPAQKQRRYRAQQPGKLKRERRAAREAELAAATLQAWQPLGARLYPVLYVD